jgi:ankyrin repeat protein
VTSRFVKACEEGNLDDIRELQAQGTIPPDYDDVFALNIACRNGTLSVARFLLSTMPAEKLLSKNSDGKNCFHLACEGSHVDVAELLVQANASLLTSLTDEALETPLHLACLGTRSILAWILDKGACIDAVNFHGQTPLYLACNSV